MRRSRRSGSSGRHDLWDCVCPYAIRQPGCGDTARIVAVEDVISSAPTTFLGQLLDHFDDPIMVAAKFTTHRDLHVQGRSRPRGPSLVSGHWRNNQAGGPLEVYSPVRLVTFLFIFFWLQPPSGASAKSTKPNCFEPGKLRFAAYPDVEGCR